MKKAYRPFLIFLVSYIVIYLLVNEAPLYWIGGAVAGSISELLNVSSNIGIWISLLLLLGVVWLYFKARSKPVKYLVIVVLFIMLYLVDVLLSDFITYDTVIKGLLALGSMILIKSAILSYLVYRDKQLGV